MVWTIRQPQNNFIFFTVSATEYDPCGPFIIRTVSSNAESSLRILLSTFNTARRTLSFPIIVALLSTEILDDGDISLRIVIVSSSPQVRFPDYYGIDMAQMNEFIAFKAAIELLKDRGERKYIMDIYEKCKAQQDKPKEEIVNYVKAIYDPFTQEDISRKMAVMLRPAEIQAEVRIVYQSLEGLHRACPNHPGDWYFSGTYPTPGGNKKVNQAFIDYIEQVFLKQGN